ncbi:ABC transporter ATP-binding protein [Tepidibacter aestuarii]|uniref:ABC transporter ATP-binding protein n=1 Tax=Tepidibacter aestuarii TaxID=2925782 RepID=UPI0020BD7B5C|nr:sn-glycerol-3-phosphate ABC transporter ATP-binding protein UgpC [Tepidibacter aestuarii]CAH2212162.1 multiple sugar (maltodextrins) transporter ATP-binding protein [Tepidibacter aestuarii]
MAELVLKNINKYYEDGYHAVKDINLEIQDKEFVVLVGPSGCGKSTTLRMIAGLEDISEGELYIDNKLVNDVSSKDRDIAMVFQNYALYPHMSVEENMAFGLKLKKVDKKEINQKVKEAAQILGIESLLKRKPKQLSGGQRQRVALGRAIVRNPKVFLMDEPLSNLDAKLRVTMRYEISKLYRKLNTTFIYVTHDQTEAMTMGTKIVVLNQGIVQQVGSPIEIYEKPKNTFVAGFIGSPQINLIEVDVIEEDGIYISSKDFKFKLSNKMSDLLIKKGYVNKKAILGIRPEDIYEKANNDLNLSEEIKLKIDNIENLGSETYLYLKSDENKYTAKVSSSINKIGQVSSLYFNLDKIHLFEFETKERIFQ